MTTSIDLFLLYPLLAGGALALMGGPVGSLLVWQRLTFLTDALAHAALLGAALAWFANVQLLWGVLLVGGIIAWWLASPNNKMQPDTDLAALSNGVLAIGLTLLSLHPGAQSVNLEVMLFGDVLTLTTESLMNIWLCAVGVLGGVLWLWRPLLQTLVSPEIAQAAGVNVLLMRRVFLLLVAGLIAFCFQHVGVLLLTGILVIPALTVRPFVQTPERMAIAASVLSFIYVILGLVLSILLDIPTGPAIIVCATLGYGVGKVISLYSSRLSF